MRTWITTAILLIAAAAISVTTAFAQRGMGGGPMLYNTATEMTISGTVDEVKTLPGRGRGMGGVHLIVTSPTGRVEVRLGPAAFVESQNFAFAQGDAVTVIGSKVTLGGAPVVIAREVQKGSERLTLRDEKGFPRWAGRGAGRSRR